MSDLNSVEYYQAREKKERALAASAVDLGVAAIHRQMADRYADLVQKLSRLSATERGALSVQFGRREITARGSLLSSDTKACAE
jgi:hypothetical protein